MTKIFLSGDYLDLFNDETIEMSDSVQNIQDITKVFTAYTQSFTVPATPKNNRVFRHWYNPEIINGFNAQERVAGFIELNDSTFKIGTFLLEKAITKKGVANSYTISFTGKTLDLKSSLSDATLADLDYTQLSFPYNATNVISFMPSDIFGNLPTLYFPLVSSKNFWTFGGGGANDISTTAGAVNWYELFPSISFDWLLRQIVVQFNLPIDVNRGDIFGSDLLVNTHLYFKNQELNKVGRVIMPTATNKLLFSTSGNIINGTNDTIKFPAINASNYLSYISYDPLYMYTFVDNNYKRIRVIYGTLSGVATLYLFRNGVEHRVVSSDISSEPIFDIEDNETYELYIKTETPQTVYLTVVCSSGVKYNKEDPFGGSFGQVVEYVQDSPLISIVTTSDVNVNQVAPKLKLIDFLKGVLTMFNGTLSIDGDSIIMQTLESWYLVGDKLNLTPYISTDSIEIIRPKLPKIVNFKKEESKSATNTAYTDLTGQKYGELSAQFPYDGSDVTYQLPFETPIPVRLSTDVMAMFLIDKESKAYTPKAMILTYAPKVTSPGIYVNNGAGHTLLPEYYPVSTTLFSSGIHRSINWGADVDQQDYNVYENSLYKVGYSNYISNLYNAQSRQISCNGNLPQSVLRKLSLNDRVQLKDMMYIINDYKVDLNNGDITFNLLTDFREAIQEVVYVIDMDEQTVSHTQDFEAGTTFETSADWYGNTPMGINYTQQTSNPITILIPENSSLATRKGHYFIFFYVNGLLSTRVVRVTIIQTGFAATPANGLITTDGEYIKTTDGEFITTT